MLKSGSGGFVLTKFHGEPYSVTDWGKLSEESFPQTPFKDLWLSPGGRPPKDEIRARGGLPPGDKQLKVFGRSLRKPFFKK
ncbi:MAG TPA: hypothetical protein VJM57_02395, partial [Thermodesulfobacteriota bacterium]|nr:hypothetical protein [Thermodesulfobacteriota bacterium]